jgi:hypothetical protein
MLTFLQADDGVDARWPLLSSHATIVPSRSRRCAVADQAPGVNVRRARRRRLPSWKRLGTSASCRPPKALLAALDVDLAGNEPATGGRRNHFADTTGSFWTLKNASALIRLSHFVRYGAVALIAPSRRPSMGAP